MADFKSKFNIGEVVYYLKPYDGIIKCCVNSVTFGYGKRSEYNLEDLDDDDCYIWEGIEEEEIHAEKEMS